MSVYWKIGSATIDALQDTHQETLEVLENLTKNFLVIQDKWTRLAQAEVGVWTKIQTEMWAFMFGLRKASEWITDNRPSATMNQSITWESSPHKAQKSVAKVHQLPQTVTKSKDLKAGILTNDLKKISGNEPSRNQKVNTQKLFSFQQRKRGGNRDKALTEKHLKQETEIFRGTGGTSEKSESHGFKPAFLDTQTGNIYLCCYADGTPAAMHLLDGLPTELVLTRSSSGRVMAAKGTLISGFVKNERFYTREEAAKAIIEPKGDVH